MTHGKISGWATTLLLAAGCWAAAAQAHGPPPGPGWGPVYRPAWGYGYGGWSRGWYGPRVGVAIGRPLAWPAPYPYAVYSPPPAVVVRETVPVPYVEAPVQPPAPAAAPTLWFYCPDPAGYHPYVQSCAQTWIPVRPQDVAPAPR